MISFFVRISFPVIFYFLLQYSGYNISIWWLIVGIPIFESLFTKWEQWTKTTSITSEQKLGGLLALLRIRSSEIGCIYHSMRSYQKQASDDNSWIPLFIGEYRYLSSQGLYEESSKTKEQKYLAKAHALYKKRFQYNHFFGVLEEPVLLDTAFAIHY